MLVVIAFIGGVVVVQQPIDWDIYFGDETLTSGSNHPCFDDLTLIAQRDSCWKAWSLELLQVFCKIL